jgi:hypothetical protein
MIWERSPYRISDDPRVVDVAVVHGFLTQSYWARGIPRDTVARGIAHSLPLSLLLGDRQVGFARVVTDRATFSYLADVFVIEAGRPRSLPEIRLYPGRRSFDPPHPPRPRRLHALDSTCQRDGRGKAGEGEA